MNKRGHEAAWLLHFVDSRGFLRGLIWADFEDAGLLSSGPFFPTIEGTASMVVFSAEGTLVLGIGVSKVKLLFEAMFEEAG